MPSKRLISDSPSDSVPEAGSAFSCGLAWVLTPPIFGRKRVESSYSTQNVTNADSSALLSVSFCRICHQDDSDSPRQDPLISPCDCRGSMRYVHKECLAVWRQVCKGKERGSIKCEACGAEYRVGSTLARIVESEVVRDLFGGLGIFATGFLVGCVVRLVMDVAKQGRTREISTVAKPPSILGSMIPTTVSNLALGTTVISALGISNVLWDNSSVTGLLTLPKTDLAETAWHSLVAPTLITGMGAYGAVNATISAIDSGMDRMMVVVHSVSRYTALI